MAIGVVAAPWGIVPGYMNDKMGDGPVPPVTVTGNEFEDPTVTLAVVGFPKNDDGMTAVSWLGDMYAVDNAVPFHETVDNALNPDPVNSIPVVPDPAGIDDGVTDKRVGIVDATTEKLTAPEEPDTVTGKFPEVAKRGEGTDAWSCEEEIYVVDNAPPFQDTVDVGINPLPYTFIVKPVPPTEAEDGLIEVTIDPPVVTLKFCTFDNPDDWPTWTLKEPGCVSIC
jgi:hypothetical protein